MTGGFPGTGIGGEYALVPFIPQEPLFGFSNSTGSSELMDLHYMVDAPMPNHFLPPSQWLHQHHQHALNDLGAAACYEGTMSSRELKGYITSDSSSTVNSVNLPTEMPPVDMEDVKLLQSNWIPEADLRTFRSAQQPCGAPSFPDMYAPSPLVSTRNLSLSLGMQHSFAGIGNTSDQSSEVSCSGLTNNGAGAMYPDGIVDMSMYQPSPRHPGGGHQMVPAVYFQVAQQLMAQFADRVLQDVPYAAGIEPSCSALALSAVSCDQEPHLCSEEARSTGGGGLDTNDALRRELERMLQMVESKYRHCSDEIQSATARLEASAQACGGAGAGAGFAGGVAPFAQCAVSILYKSVKERIAKHLAALEQERSWESSFFKKHWALQQARRSGEQQSSSSSWRPQRGLPEKSVAVLRAWMFDNFLRPYPKDDEKDQLAARSGLTRNQVSNWFINARVRLWRPLVEEMCAEMSKRSSSPSTAGLQHQDGSVCSDGFIHGYATPSSLIEAAAVRGSSYA